ncbi:MAG: phosphoribosylformylglycinamidine synthase subunit PurQ [Planctomycetaceae bacterium]|jgi:phosphoribosylformylglycinamidine synthase|nr:phosphoribosylformylglycinamidine synthase subunit PurQ [Planctomycetaceae bacterium]
MANVLIIRAPGTNCDIETKFAFQVAGAARVDVFHINRLLESSGILNDYQILCLPGGFSYGDDIGAGKVLASKLSRNLGEILRSFCDSDKLIIGICNGFQSLLKSGLLLSDGVGGSLATLAWNETPVYTDRWVHLRTNNSSCAFLREIDELYLPIAHGEGRFVPINDSTILSTLNRNGQLALKYVEGENPNGSVADVAGVCDQSGRIFGLMPHPERFIDIFQHPHWTRLPELKYNDKSKNKSKSKNNRKESNRRGDGLKIFQNAVSYFS